MKDERLGRIAPLRCLSAEVVLDRGMLLQSLNRITPFYSRRLTEWKRRTVSLRFDKSRGRVGIREGFGEQSRIPILRTFKPRSSSCFLLSSGDRIIKTSDLNGNIEYSHQMYGSYVSKGQPKWNPVLIPIPNPVMAIKIAQTGLDTADPMAPRIIRSLPSMSLKCPSCNERFEVTADLLPVDGFQNCTSCAFEAPNERFADYKL